MLVFFCPLQISESPDFHHIAELRYRADHWPKTSAIDTFLLSYSVPLLKPKIGGRIGLDNSDFIVKSLCSKNELTVLFVCIFEDI